MDDLRWVAPQQQHITLRFLGNVDPVQQQLLIQRLEQALSCNQAFDCMTGHFEFFPNARNPRALTLGIHSGQELKRLAALCEDIAVETGFTRESRYFRPHVTLGRFKTHRHVTHSHFYNLPAYRMTVGEIQLMKSISREGGNEYKTIHVFPLHSIEKTA